MFNANADVSSLEANAQVSNPDTETVITNISTIKAILQGSTDPSTKTINPIIVDTSVEMLIPPQG